MFQCFNLIDSVVGLRERWRSIPVLPEAAAVWIRSLSPGERMKFEDAKHFPDGLGILVRAVVARRNKLRISAVHMGTPILHEAVAGVRRVAPATVADDGVIRNV